MEEKVAVGDALGLIVDDFLTAFVLVNDELFLWRDRSKIHSVSYTFVFNDINIFVKSMNIVICDILLTIFSLWVAEATGGFLFRTESERHCQRHYSKDNILKNNISVILIVYFKKYIIILKNVGSQTVCVTIASHYMNRNTVEVKGKTETVWLATFFSVLQKKRKSYMFGMNRTEFQFFWGGGVNYPFKS